MPTATPQTILLTDYRAPGFALPLVDLLVQIFATHTRVTNTVRVSSSSSSGRSGGSRDSVGRCVSDQAKSRD